MNKQPVQRLRGRAAVERRKRWLSENPLCADCLQEGWVTLATVPDHVVALVNGGEDTESNLRSLCESHHRKKTAKDMGYTYRPAVGLDGWPVDYPK